ncbi:cysteine desulfurase [Candidatus Poribacteria bacterium]|jgi:cysteine desulfurase|nr:cysteine desulfurase [Candidatus Poribacteria bacterium]MBT5712636.1 cysteine desulfurase [Candidatus Poribacteria bacterium]MBT7096840.1 cysteine desulfurase [Candidatus Poribacteria bacterium]MBT7808036.1 cysteine desulfurase [Candidatus Poribacteria bacterium]
MDPIYMDHHATTPLDARVLDAMMPYLTHEYGNASSRTHPWGWHAEEAVDAARQQVAAALNCRPDEVVFTGGATESNNLAIKGVAAAYRDRGKRHIVTTKVEHSAVREPCQTLEGQGFAVTYLDVDRFGMVDPDDVRSAITDETALISVIWAHNEIGTIQPLAEIGRIASDAGVLLHTDGVQAFAKYDSDVERLGVDLIALSAHKICGPKGVGALYVRKRRPRIRMTAQIEGGGQERKLRSGTLNVPGIVGLGKAVELYGECRDDERRRVTGLRDRLRDAILGSVDFVHLNGHPTERLYNNLNLSFEFVESESLLMALRGIALSSGSACTSASMESSSALLAIGMDDSLAHSAVRFGVGRANTADEVDAVAAAVVDAVARQRELSPLYAMKRQGVDVMATE